MDKKTSKIDWQLYFKAKEFLKNSFIRNPDYSFGDPLIMIEHSLNVANIGLNLSMFYPFDINLVAIGCMFHDIGKAILVEGKPLNQDVLRQRHEDFNAPMIESFLRQNQIEALFGNDLKRVFEANSIENVRDLIKDADIIELYMNVRLQKALKKWADDNSFPNEMQRKADKFAHTLKFEKSRELAKPYWEIFKLRWKLS